jgi:hypothetical protein
VGGGLLYYQRAALAQKKPSGLKLLKLLGGRARCPPPRHPPFAAANIRVSLASLLGRVQAPPHPLALRTGLACAPPGEHRRWNFLGDCNITKLSPLSRKYKASIAVCVFGHRESGFRIALLNDGIPKPRWGLALQHGEVRDAHGAARP